MSGGVAKTFLGKIGTGIIKGLLKQARLRGLNKYRFSATVRTQASLERLKEDFKLEHHLVDCDSDSANARVAWQADLVINACGAQHVGPVLHSIAQPSVHCNLETMQQRLLRCKMSLAVTSLSDFDTLRSKYRRVHLPTADRIVPSLGCSDGQSVTLFVSDSGKRPTMTGSVAFDELFLALGTVHYVPRRSLAQAASLRAFCNSLSLVQMECLSDSAVTQGMSREAAVKLITAALHETGSLLSGGKSTDELKNQQAVLKNTILRCVLALAPIREPMATQARSVYEDMQKRLGTYSEKFCRNGLHDTEALEW